MEKKQTIDTMNGKYISSQAEITKNTLKMESVPNNWNLPSIDQNVLVLADDPERVEIASRPPRSRHIQLGRSIGLNMSIGSRNVAVLLEDSDVVEMISGTFPSMQQCHLGSKVG
jgi:hypothetical protein